MADSGGDTTSLETASGVTFLTGYGARRAGLYAARRGYKALGTRLLTLGGRLMGPVGVGLLAADIMIEGLPALAEYRRVRVMMEEEMRTGLRDLPRELGELQRSGVFSHGLIQRFIDQYNNGGQMLPLLRTLQSMETAFTNMGWRTDENGVRHEIEGARAAGARQAALLIGREIGRTLDNLVAEDVQNPQARGQPGRVSDLQEMVRSIPDDPEELRQFVVQSGTPSPRPGF
jgi:hypothetical protein